MRVVQTAVGSVDDLLTYSGDEAWGTVSQGPGPQAVAMRLDTILDETALVMPTLLRPPFALKIDVEGHEYHALLGAERFLEQHRPTVLFESIETGGANDRTRECKDLLVSAGYSLFMLKDGILIPKTSADVQEELVADFSALPPGAVPPLGHEVRQPTTEERTAWLDALEAVSPDHKHHAERVRARLAELPAAR